VACATCAIHPPPKGRGFSRVFDKLIKVAESKNFLDFDQGVLNIVFDNSVYYLAGINGRSLSCL